ncbi:hypothetical protein V2J09_005045, partial [Rumex salicifolius]
FVFSRFSLPRRRHLSASTLAILSAVLTARHYPTDSCSIFVMGDFVFEQPSDEEPQGSDSMTETNAGELQSPWDFSTHSKSVAEEHNLHSTTSIDQKIYNARKQRAIPVPYPSDQEDSDDSRCINKDDHQPEEDDDDDDDDAAEVKPFFTLADGVSFHAKSFMELKLSRPLLRACQVLGYTKPTPIQAACVPLALNRRDICGSAITGSGKTAAFSLPILEYLWCKPRCFPAIRVLILTPTRELAAQIHSMIGKLAQYTDIKCSLIVGGLSMREQEVALRSRPDIVIATPGRMIDHLRNSMSVDLDNLTFLILDEADRLLELGFTSEISELVRLCPKSRQTMLFSATMTEEVDELIKKLLNKPLRISADPSAKRPEFLTEEVVRIRGRMLLEAHQEALLLALCSKTFNSKVIIFCGEKRAAHRLKILFGLAGFNAAELHGNLTQAQRLDALELFRKQQVDFLLATDVASRGLDIVGVQTVINFATPRDLNSYIHRVGRTARAGKAGHAITFVTDNDRSLLKSIAKRAGSKLKSRIVAEQSINQWVQTIEQMEDQISEILQEEEEEMALRRAQMEVAKAENMIEYRNDIFSRPRKTWFITEREKKEVAKAAKESSVKEKGGGKEIVSAEQAEEIKMKEKLKRERERKLPEKKRRRLEAARERLKKENEDDDDDDDKQQNKKGRKEKGGIRLVDLAYRRAKGAKAKKKAKHTEPPTAEEVEDPFQEDSMNEKHSKRVEMKKAPKNSFKSKSRYKRRK